MPTIKEEGKRFSRRTVEEHGTEDGTFYLEHIRWDDHFTASTIERYHDCAIKILKANGIDVDAILKDSPHGSHVRSYVIDNKKQNPDALPALAARILELCLHVSAYQKTPGGEQALPGLAFRLGRMTMLFEAYQIEAELQGARRKGKPLADCYDNTRDDRLRKFHARLKDAKDATKQTADEFGISARQVRNILKRGSGSIPGSSGT